MRRKHYAALPELACASVFATRRGVALMRSNIMANKPLGPLPPMNLRCGSLLRRLRLIGLGLCAGGLIAHMALLSFIPIPFGRSILNTLTGESCNLRHFSPQRVAMTDWRDHLTPDERKRMDEIKAERLALNREYRRIFDRARKRVERIGNGQTSGTTDS